MSDLLDSLQDMVAFKHDDMSVAKEAINHIETQAARIAKLEAALQDMSKHVWRGDWDKLKPETRALLPGGKDGST